MKVSLVLPIYNGEKTLIETLKSLSSQTFQDFELVACIDGTEDGSENILESYRRHFSRLIILKNTRNLGLGPTMYRLVANSQGKYIAVAEQDDYYYPNRLQLQVDLLDTNDNVGLVSGIAEFWDGNKVTSIFPGILDAERQYPEGKEMFLLNYKHQIKVVNSCLMFRKQVHIDNGLYFTQHFPSISVDWTYVLRFSLVSKIYGLRDVLVRVDRAANRNSVTSNKDKQYKAARELIRSMAYEFPDIISRKDFNYACRTQLLLEWSSQYGVSFFIVGIYYNLMHWNDERFLHAYKKRVDQFRNKKRL